MEVLSKSTKDTKKLAGSIAEKLKPGDVLALYGDLGAGKTTFTTFLVHALGIEKRVQSPTFIISRKYSGGDGKIHTVNHIDLYRLKDEEEVSNLDLSESFGDPGSIVVIEWPKLAGSILPKDTIKINFEYVGENERQINVQNLN